MKLAELLMMVVLGSAPAEVGTFQDGSDLFIRVGSSSGVRMGSEVLLLGDRIGDTPERRVLGKATVMEVWETIARIVPEEAARAAKPQAARIASPPVSPPPARTAVARQPSTTDPAQPAKPQSAKGTSAAMGFSDHLTAQCGGAQVDVFARSTALGGLFRLMISGEVATERQLNAGSSGTLEGRSGNKPVTLQVTQGLFGTDYVLRVGGKPCELTNL